MTLKILFYSLIFLVLSGCGGSKLKQSMKEGKTLEKDYLTTVPFVFKNDLIVVEVKIDNRIYNFILDTGATNMVSKELAEELKLKSLGTEEIFDIHGNSQNLGYAKIDTIRIGGINFLNTTTGISDFFTEVLPFSCMKVDGIIGSNLMQHAVWDFDFKNQKITITNNESNLNIPSSYKKSKIYIGYGGLASITSKVNGHKILNNAIDFGYNGGIVIPLSEFMRQKENGKIAEFIKGFGELPVGAFGNTGQNNFFTSRIKEIKFGDLVIKNKLVYSDQSTGNRFGLEFFKDYRVILNWNKKHIKMIENQINAKDAYTGYGYSLRFFIDHLIVSSIIEGSSASKYLKIGDQILRIAGKDYSILKQKEWCKIRDVGFAKHSKNELHISISRDGEKFQYKLRKEELL